MSAFFSPRTVMSHTHLSQNPFVHFDLAVLAYWKDCALDVAEKACRLRNEFGISGLDSDSGRMLRRNPVGGPSGHSIVTCYSLAAQHRPACEVVGSL